MFSNLHHKWFKEILIKFVLLGGSGITLFCFDLIETMADKRGVKQIACDFLVGLTVVVSRWQRAPKALKLPVLFVPVVTVLQVCPREIIPKAARAW